MKAGPCACLPGTSHPRPSRRWGLPCPPQPAVPAAVSLPCVLLPPGQVGVRRSHVSEPR